jgi:hypothetical protein
MLLKLQHQLLCLYALLLDPTTVRLFHLYTHLRDLRKH